MPFMGKTTPEKQVKAKLDSIPVFVVTNDKGLPLSRTLPTKNGQQTISVTGAYMSRQEALKFIQDLQKAKNKNPKLQAMAKNLQVTAVPLGVIYQQLQQNRNKPNRLVFAFKPVDREVRGALTLLQASGQKVDAEKFKTSVPIFAVRFAPDKGYVPIQGGQNKQQMIPLFLSKQDAQNLLNKVKPKFPQADIQVINFDGVIKTLKDKNDSWLNQVFLVPSAESRKYIETLPKK
ncbi:MAG: hypothetical protein F6K62_05730, partial [Sphaerospermopsis sp. SIO1G2]|nr:hypothetical protein [Sphaerospermopsis sp. SIO1G2]